ncbi:MAG: ATP-binding protein, partial [Thermoguttaceae bacterium]
EYDAQNAKARIIVEDDGPGIPVDQMDFLFSPFVSSKKSRGTGLGLPVSQKILREHGGQIQVHSEPGRGARFILEIPAVLPSPDQIGSEITIHSDQEKKEEEGRAAEE